MEETGYTARGVKTRLMGFILMVLGALDSLLTLRGGIVAYEYLAVMVAGGCVFAIGAVRGGREQPAGKEEQRVADVKAK